MFRITLPWWFSIICMATVYTYTVIMFIVVVGSLLEVTRISYYMLTKIHAQKFQHQNMFIFILFVYMLFIRNANSVMY